MKDKKLLKIFVIVLIIFFQIRLLSHIFLKWGESEDGQNKQKPLKVSHLFFPLDYFVSYKYAMYLFEKGVLYKNDPLILKSINWLKKSIRQNPFFHLSHHNLGKAYLLYNFPERQFFRQGIQELKSAVQIDKSNKFMVKDTAEVLLSMWPLLSEKDKTLCKNLLLGFMSKFSWEEFKPVVELWWLYSKDIPFLKQLIEENKAILNDLSLFLVELKGPLNLRWEFLADYETYILKKNITRYRNRYSLRQTRIDFDQSLLESLREIRLYHKLARKSFDHSKFVKHKKILISNRINELLRKNQLENNSQLNDNLYQLIIEYVKNKPEMKDLIELENNLEEKGFFGENNFSSLYLKYWLKFNQGNLNDVIDEIEKLKGTITLIKKEALQHYKKILLLLSNAYESSKLLTIANRTLREILKISQNNAEVWLRLFLIQKILGPDIEIQNQILVKIEDIKQSRFLNVNSQDFKKTVYLIDNKQVEINLAENLKERLGDKKIIQIFINGRIVYEEYLSQLPQRISIDVEEGNEVKKLRLRLSSFNSCPN